MRPAAPVDLFDVVERGRSRPHALQAVAPLNRRHKLVRLAIPRSHASCILIVFGTISLISVAPTQKGSRHPERWRDATPCKIVITPSRATFADLRAFTRMNLHPLDYRQSRRLLFGMALGSLEASRRDRDSGDRRHSRRMTLQLGLLRLPLTSTASVRLGPVVGSYGRRRVTLPADSFLVGVALCGERTRAELTSFGVRGSRRRVGAAGDDNHRGSTRWRTALAIAGALHRHGDWRHRLPYAGGYLTDAYPFDGVRYQPPFGILTPIVHWVGVSALSETRRVTVDLGWRALPLCRVTCLLRALRYGPPLRCCGVRTLLTAFAVVSAGHPNRSCRSLFAEKTDCPGRFLCVLSHGMFGSFAFSPAVRPGAMGRTASEPVSPSARIPGCVRRRLSASVDVAVDIAL